MSKTIIIAEAGVNHNGDIEIAKKLIDVAVDAGVDYVKFQTFKAERLVSPSAPKAEYQIENDSCNDDLQLNMLKKLELSEDNHKELILYCESRNISFFSTAFDEEGIFYLSSLNFDMLKIPSGELTNYPYLRAVAKTGLPVVVSTGMAYLDEIAKAINVLVSFGTKKDKITVLHCNTEYPTPMIDVNLMAMLTIKDKLGVSIGYSDHTLGIEVPIAAVALGAKIIEKHFTLDRQLPGPDHKASLEPDELKSMVSAIRNIEEAISGNGRKEPSQSESKNIAIARKSIHLKNRLVAGATILEDDLIALRPGDGISAMKWTDIIGRNVSKDLDQFDKLTWGDLS